MRERMAKLAVGAGVLTIVPLLVPCLRAQEGGRAVGQGHGLFGGSGSQREGFD